MNSIMKLSGTLHMLACLFLLTSCISVSGVTGTPSWTETHIAPSSPTVETPSPVPAVSETPTMMPITAVPPPTPFNTPTGLKPQDTWITNCIELAPVFSATVFNSSGQILLDNLSDPDHQYALDIATGNPITLKKDWQSIFYDVSPDEQRLVLNALNVSNTLNLKITNPRGVTQMVLPDRLFGLPAAILGYSSWLDKTHLLFYRRENDGYKYTTVVLNPFTGERQELPPIYPDMANFIVANGPHLFSPLTAYNPALTRVIYPYYLHGTGEEGYRLWDLQTQQILATLPMLSHDSDPIWSPDGQKAVVISRRAGPGWGHGEWFEIDPDGQTIQLTNLSAAGQIHDEYYSWSPDSRYLAFWLTVPGQADGFVNLAILDLSIHEVTNYCILGKVGGLVRPIWAPNYNQLVVSGTDSDSRTITVVVDIERKIAAKIGGNQTPYFWLKTIPPVIMEMP